MAGGGSVALLLLPLLAALCCQARIERRCYSRALGEYFNEGAQWTQPGCLLARCRRGRITQGHCPVLIDGPQSNCHVKPGAKNAPFPACCPSIECPPQPEKTCYVPHLDRHFAVGESWTTPGCSQATCQEGGRVSGRSCGLIAAPPGDSCSLDHGDDSLEYPQCCPKFTCPECYSERLRRTFGPGDTWTGSDCTGEVCRINDAGVVMVSALPCPLVALPFPDCELVDKSPEADYPDCCPSFRCPGRCFSKAQNRWFAVGESWTEEGCARATCRGTDQVSALGCGLIALPPGSSCSLDDGDDSLEYPQCCPKVTCPECYSERLNRSFGPGDTWTGSDCTGEVCRINDAGVVLVSALPCPLVARPFPDCELVDNSPEADYPDCCPSFRCPGRCFSKAQNRWFAVGESWTEEGCAQATCRGTDQVSALGCGLIALPPGSSCSLDDGDDSLEYPQCCPKVTCPECYSERLNRSFGPGDTWTGSDCTGEVCRINYAGVVMVSALPCPLVALPFPDCEMVDKSPEADFPDCCLSFRCPGRCFSKTQKRWFAVGETWTEEGCTKASCLSTDRVAEMPCGLIALKPGCQAVPSPPSAEYPECCPALRCPGGCFSRSLRQWFAVGRSWTEPDCEYATCVGTEMVITEPCPLVGVPGGCTVVDGHGDSFPGCCPTLDCGY